jgi:hypothetical protein
LKYRDQEGKTHIQEMRDYIHVRKPKLIAGGDVVVIGPFTDPEDIPEAGKDMLIISRLPKK